MSFAYLRLPATNAFATSDRPHSSLSAPMIDLPFASSSEMWRWAPQPASPLIGFDMKVPIRLVLVRDLLDGVLVRVGLVGALQAVARPEVELELPGPVLGVGRDQVDADLRQHLHQIEHDGVEDVADRVEDVVPAEQRRAVGVQEVVLVLHAGLDAVAHLLRGVEHPLEQLPRRGHARRAVDRVGGADEPRVARAATG